MKRLFLAYLLISQWAFCSTTILFSYSSDSNPPQIQKCSMLFIELIKSSSYDFKQWGEAYTKDNISFLIDTWDTDKILVKLFLDHENPMQGSGTIAWIQYDLKTQNLTEFITDTKLSYDRAINSLFQNCLTQTHD